MTTNQTAQTTIKAYGNYTFHVMPIDDLWQFTCYHNDEIMLTCNFDNENAALQAISDFQSKLGNETFTPRHGNVTDEKLASQVTDVDYIARNPDFFIEALKCTVDRANCDAIQKRRYDVLMSLYNGYSYSG